MIDSPYHPYSDTRFTINEKSIDDLEDNMDRKKDDDDYNHNATLIKTKQTKLSDF
jgi:hypothetical protein